MGIYKHLLCSISLVFICLSACAGTGADSLDGKPAGVPQAPAPGSGLQLLPLSLQVSGGIAGRNETIDIAVGGLATWTNARNRTSGSRQFSDREMVRLQALLAEIPGTENGENGSPPPGRCRDCFVYRLSLSSPNKPQNLTISSDRMATSAYRDLTTLLLSIGDAIRREENR